MESFKLPLREINKRYRKSEIVILAWSSAETSFKMKRQIEESKTRRERTKKKGISKADLGTITDAEARKELAQMGLDFPIMTE